MCNAGFKEKNRVGDVGGRHKLQACWMGASPQEAAGVSAREVSGSGLPGLTGKGCFEGPGILGPPPCFPICTHKDEPPAGLQAASVLSEASFIDLEGCLAFLTVILGSK